MTEPEFSLSAFAARQQPAPSVPLPPPVRHAPKSAEPPLLDGNVDEEDDGEIICICNYNWDDGYTIQCETCNKWNHMECYYPNESDRPGQDQTHYCVDCQPRDIDAKRAATLQREKHQETLRDNGNKRPVSKGGRKKAKEVLDNGPIVNGWSADKHSHLHGHGRERKSASPRDQPPPAKRPKTAHRSSAATANGGTGRKRNGSTLNAQRSPSKSPAPTSLSNGIIYGPPIPACSEEFLQIPKLLKTHVNTDTNIWNSIDVTHSLSDWLQDPEAVERDCQLKQIEVFKRWDGPFENLPGKPEVSMQIRADTKFTQTGEMVQYPCITGEEHIMPSTFIGELLGHVGFKSEYMDSPDSRWKSLRHCEPFVFFHPKLPLYIDARQEGSVYRYVRRSCRPNAEIQTIITEGTTYHFCFMATKDILPGEEITVGWEFDDRIRAMYAQRSHMTDSAWAPDVRDKIAAWVSNVLSNCGPCACSGQGCPMGFFDRRGQSFPLDAQPATMKAPKRKRKIAHNTSPDESGRNSNQASRSGSEARNVEGQEEDMTDSRSVSGSYRGSASRDMTPSTHYSVAALAPELSERERKKLMREEEMFKKQEEEKGKQRKKRNSGGTNLNTPSANASVCCDQAMLEMLQTLTPTHHQRQLGQPTNSKYADAGTSSKNPTTSSRSSTGRRGGRQAQSSSRGESKSSVKPTPRPTYVDSAIQCDMDNDEPITKPVVTPPKRKQYISITQRLLRRCASNNFKRKAESIERDASDDIKTLPPPPQGDTMDIDKDESPKPEAETADVLPLSPISDKVKEAEAIADAQAEAVSKPVSTMSPIENHDSEMKDADDEYEPEPATTPPRPAQQHIKPDLSSPHDEEVRLTSNPPMDPPPPPWPTKAPTESPTTAKEVVKGELVSRPELHLPIPAMSTEAPSASGSTEESAQGAPKSPSVQTQALTPNSIFPPSVSAALNPSPIARKKMSLSDYTKRSKAQRPESAAGTSHRESSPATSVDLKDNVLHGTAVSESPAPESIPPSSAEERNMDHTVAGVEEDQLEEGEMILPVNATFGDGGLPTTVSAAPTDMIPNAAGSVV